VTESPEIPFELFGVKMKAKGAYKGPLQKPTEASFSLT
jgi:hypothetical protein